MSRRVTSPHSGRPLPAAAPPNSACASAARISRRGWLEVGYSTSLGLGLTGILGRSVAHAGNPTETLLQVPRARRVLLIFLFGGPSQLDTFDPKPAAPVECRSIFEPIATRLPGVQVCEHLPGLAQRLDRCSLLRTLSTNPNFGDHRLAVHGMLGGINELPPGAALAASRKDWPSLGGVLNYLRPSGPDSLPVSMTLAGELIDPATGSYPGQTAGLLGAGYDPYWIKQDPNAADYAVDASLKLPAGISLRQIADKQALLAEFDAQRAAAGQMLETGAYPQRQQEAWNVLASGRLAEALDVSREAPARRERYGRHLFGQSLLLARRLLESGVTLVQANVGYHALWDTHYNNFVGHRDHLPHLDRAVSALLDDLAERGLWDDTLVVMLGEFGRTPKLVQPDGKIPFFTSPGRDHWMSCFCGLFAGAGVHPGQVIGRSDAMAAFPATAAFTPADVAASIYSALGISGDRELADLQGRPLKLNNGQVIRPLYDGAAV